MAYRSSSKSRSRSKERLANFNSRLCMSGENRDLSHVSWKALRKRSPWLKLLKEHQLTGTEAIVSTDGYAALFEQRTGKTWVTGAVLEIERDENHDVLIVGPLTNLHSTWGKFIGEKLTWFSVHHDFDAFVKARKADPAGYRILLLNYEAVTPLVKKMRRITWDRIIYDEAQRLKNRTSRSSRDAGLLAKSGRKRLALTGTPMDLDPKDLWGLMRFVKPGLLCDGWGDFEEEFLVKPTIDKEKMRKVGVIGRQKLMLAYQIAKRKAPVREDKLDELGDLMSLHAMRISKEDAGMTRANVRPVRFDLDPQERKMYDQLEKRMIVKHKGKTIKTPLKIVQIGKLQQITGGYIKDEEGELHDVGKSKRRLLKRKIRQEANDEPFVVFCKYVWEVHMLWRLLKNMGFGKGAKLWGKVKDIKTDKRRTNMLLGFQRGEFPWIVCQQRTGGVGVDLYYARKFFVYSMGHSYIDYDQMLSRGDFIEQDDPADFFILLARSSIDIDVFSTVKGKKSITERFYDRLNR